MLLARIKATVTLNHHSSSLEFLCENKQLIVQLQKSFLNQARAGLWPARTWFLKIDPVRIVSMRVCVCVCLCVRARGS